MQIDITFPEHEEHEEHEEQDEENGFPYSYLGIQEEIRSLVQQRIQMALLLCNGNKTAAAELLGLPSYQTLTNWMTKYGVENDK
tara:strand:- start:390 stop:641 length:252 start_codon:yes stop_codon:yes gene_type:complete